MADTSKPRRPAHPLARPQAPARKPAAKRPLPVGEQFFTPGATGFRRAVEQRSATVLVFLYQLPRWVVPLVLVGLLLTGFVVADWRGGLAVLPVLGFVAWLGYMSWPSLRIGGRLLRVALATFLLLVALTRFGLI
ncbi:hypothetical protein Aph01nite_74480 [Acrocarpospora phusangensis]|uniref:Uncharacterized protein n=1 Tax=Acrocarpospora phusangensis TaxID=1070424 RepID=A0A919QHZ4_9ACTN|nr:DUF6703 family protein [Acrocarpospora phusangensis]GIH29138.1 hypothetical protein Aph01nite_74480 [Acrocarpospora phusangensis]